MLEKKELYKREKFWFVLCLCLALFLFTLNLFEPMDSFGKGLIAVIVGFSLIFLWRSRDGCLLGTEKLELIHFSRTRTFSYEEIECFVVVYKWRLAGSTGYSIIFGKNPHIRLLLKDSKRVDLFFEVDEMMVKSLNQYIAYNEQ